jgi:hypothetical protein
VDNEEFGRIIRKIAEMDLAYEAMREDGTVSEAEHKAYQAERGELIQALDEESGTADVTYAEFRRAFDAGIVDGSSP